MSGILQMLLARGATAGGGTPALIAHDKASDAANAGFATTPAQDTTGANLIVISASWFTGTTANVTISDSKGNTWTGLTQSGTNWKNQLFYCVSPTVGSGHTFTMTGAATVGSVAFQAWSNMSTSSPFDQQSGGANASSTTVATGSITPSQANTVCIVGYTTGNNARTFVSFSGGYSSSDHAPAGSGTNGGGGMGYLVLTSASAQNVTTTFSNLCTNVSRIASFKY